MSPGVKGKQILR